MDNQKIANILYEVANILEIKNIPWKPRAYRRAAQNIESLPEDIKNIYKEGKLQDIPGIGEGIAKKISDILKKGYSPYLRELKKQVPKQVEQLTEFQNIGPKTASLLYKKLKIKNLKELKKAIKQGKLRKIKGFKEKKEQALLEGLQKKPSKRFLLGEILPIAEEIKKQLKQYAINIDLAGSIRRKKETIGDIDIISSSNNPGKLINSFTSLKDIKKILAKGQTKASIKLKNNLQIDIRTVKPSVYGAALHYFTGSKQHSIHLRKIAISKNMKLNEYGLFKKNRLIAANTEQSIYKALNLQYIPPELREDQGEIETAQKNKLPSLINYKDIKADLHVHSNYSDGANSIEEIAKAAKKLKYNYIAITDHAGSLKIAKALTKKQFLKQSKEIDSLNKKFSNFKILKGAEVNITKTGLLDVPNSILKELDLVIAGIHYGFKADATKRILKAFENPYLNILVHPSGRLINKRNPYNIDFEKLFEKAKENNVFLEINSFPDRLDLNDINARAAILNKVKLIINTDTHSIAHLNFMHLGVSVARRAWCEKKDIINTLNLKQFEKIIKNKS